MTQPWVIDNKCVKYPDPTMQWGIMASTRIISGICALWPWSWRYYQGHDTPVGHGQQLCEILSRSNLAMRSYGPDTDFGYVCTVTLTLELWPLVKIMTHSWVMDNNRVKYYPDSTWLWGVMARKRVLGMCVLWPWPKRYDLGSRSWHTLWSWTTIVWNITQIGQVCKKLLPGHNVDRRTDRVIPINTQNFVCGGYNYNHIYIKFLLVSCMQTPGKQIISM